MITCSIPNIIRLTQRAKRYFSTRTAADVEFHQYDSFMKVLLNKPKALNSLNLNMIRAIKAELPAINQNKAVWFEGVGGKAFCAGGDVKELFVKDAKVEDRLTFFRE
jgi:enoyl-CoA hydratase/carnithine racemase